MPDDHPIGTKRIVRRHRLLRDLQPRQRRAWSTCAATPIERDHADAASARRTASTSSTCIVFATGFDAMTGALLGIDIRGRGGRDADARSGRTARAPTSGSRSRASRTCSSITGPGSPSVLTNMVVSIEQHVDWIADCIAHLREHGLDAHRGRRARREDGWVAARQRGRPTRRSTRRRTPGTSARTSPASRGCSCPMSAAAASIGRSATRWCDRTTPDSASPAWPPRNAGQGERRRLPAWRRRRMRRGCLRGCATRARRPSWWRDPIHTA